MCGIIGSVNWSFDTDIIDEVMGHRGPNERNNYIKDNVQFYHLRLSILDISRGQQPMHYLDRYTIIFNGEIYNHQELRKRFNLACHTNSDTETILHIYHKLGHKCLNEFDGMFAFAIYDKVKRKIFLARDRAGKKPLYIFNGGNKFVFASELNAVKAILPLKIKENHIRDYLRLGSMYGKQTPYEDVTDLRGGHYAIIDAYSNTLNITKWWTINDYYQIKSTHSYKEAKDNVENFLIDGVKRRIDSSDLEVGAFLSGGIDSGLVTAIASANTNNLRTFTVSFKGEYDEAPLAKLVADRYATNHTQIDISFDNLLSDIEKIICNYGEPFFDSSAIPSYYVSEAAKKYITVVLNGDGADELFGGYRRYVPFAAVDFFKLSSTGKRLMKSIHQYLPVSNNKKSKYNYLYRLIDFAGKNGKDAYLSATTDILEGYLPYLSIPSFESKEIDRNFSPIIDSNKLTGLQKIMNLDFDTILFSDLLVKMDIATMAHSLEGRSPFLVKELMEYAPTINDTYKVKGTKTKRILRELAKDYLPNKLVGQPKRGFEIPLKKWVNNDLKELIFDYLGSNAYCQKFFKDDFIEKVKKNQFNMSEEKRAKILWTLFSLEVWYKKVYCNA